MIVQFATNQLERCYEDFREGARSWGADVAKRYQDRIDLMLVTASFQQIFPIAALRLHPLRGGRAGQYSIRLTGRWRLILTPSPDGNEVLVQEVSNHYGD